MSYNAEMLARDILEVILAQAGEQSLDAIDFNTAIRYANRIAFSWDAKDIKLGWTELTGPSSEVTIAYGARNAIIYNAALQLSTTYDVPVGPVLAVEAKEELETARIIGMNFENMNYPSTLPIGSGNTYSTSSNTFKYYPGCLEDQDQCCDE